MQKTCSEQQKNNGNKIEKIWRGKNEDKPGKIKKSRENVEKKRK